MRAEHCEHRCPTQSSVLTTQPFICDPVAQWEERRSPKPGVARSSRAGIVGTCVGCCVSSFKVDTRSRGGIGRHAALRWPCLRACRFESCREHFLLRPSGEIGKRSGFKPRPLRVRIPLGPAFVFYLSSFDFPDVGMRCGFVAQLAEPRPLRRRLQVRLLPNPLLSKYARLRPFCHFA